MTTYFCFKEKEAYKQMLKLIINLIFEHMDYLAVIHKDYKEFNWGNNYEKAINTVSVLDWFSDICKNTLIGYHTLIETITGKTINLQKARENFIQKVKETDKHHRSVVYDFVKKFRYYDVEKETQNIDIVAVNIMKKYSMRARLKNEQARDAILVSPISEDEKLIKYSGYFTSFVFYVEEFLKTCAFIFLTEIVTPEITNIKNYIIQEIFTSDELSMIFKVNGEEHTYNAFEIIYYLLIFIIEEYVEERRDYIAKNVFTSESYQNFQQTKLLYIKEQIPTSP